MNKFNLTFTGKILPGYDPERVKAEFGRLFLIDEPARIEQFFAGKSVTLRRNLDRKAAGTLYAKLHKAGADVALEKVPDAEQQAELPEKSPEPQPTPQTPVQPTNRGMNHEIREEHAGVIDQSWPVSATRPGPRSEITKAKSGWEKELSRKHALELEAARKADESKALEQETRRRALEKVARQREQEKAAKRRAEEEAAKVRAREDESRRKVAATYVGVATITPAETFRRNSRLFISLTY